MELDLLERAQEAVGNDPLPEALHLEDAGMEAWHQQFDDTGRQVVEISRKGVAKMEELLAAVRAHPDNNPPETFRELGPLLSARIDRREDQLGQLVAIELKARRIKDSTGKSLSKALAKVIVQIGREHRSLVTLYYLLKADADEVAPDTRGGPVLSSEADIDKYFDGLQASK